MKYFLLAAIMLCNINPAAQAQGGKAPPANAIVIDETKTVEVAPKKKVSKPKVGKTSAKSGSSSVTKKVSADKNKFITTTTTTKVVPAPAAAATPASNYPAQNYTAPAVSAPATAGTVTTTTTTTTTPPSAAPVATSVAAAPEAPKSPWRMVYFGEYVGPRLSNLDLMESQGPEDSTASYTAIDHSLKLAYALAKNNILGTQVRAFTSFDPDSGFGLKDLRFYITWKNMIDTADINMGTETVLELPTSDASREARKLFAIDLKLNWEIKTQLRNWSFTAMTMIRTIFVDAAGSQTNLYLGLFPWVTYTFAPDWDLVFEGSFDASHSYNDPAFNYNSADPDFVNIGVQYSFSPHLQVNPAFRFYTGNISFKAAVLYTSLTASL